MARDIPQAAYDLIKRFEGFSATKYEDPPGSGGYSIGYGHHLRDVEFFLEPISEQEAQEQLEFDLANVAAEIDRLVKPEFLHDLTDGQYAALVDFVFNEGAGHFQSSTMLQLINQGAFVRAGNEFPRWDYVSGEPSPGLLKRREAEQALWTQP